MKTKTLIISLSGVLVCLTVAAQDIDGTSPRWDFVWERRNRASALRGLTAVPDPNGGSHQVLIGGLEGDGHLVRFDPTQGSVTVQLDIRRWLGDQLGGAGPALAAYNNMVEAVEPATGRTVHLISLWSTRTDKLRYTPPHNGSTFLIRHLDGSYAWDYVYDFDHPVPENSSLRGTRTIAPSPFPDEKSRVWYLGGFDGRPGDRHHDTAWSYKATLHDLTSTNPIRSTSQP